MIDHPYKPKFLEGMAEFIDKGFFLFRGTGSEFLEVN